MSNRLPSRWGSSKYLVRFINPSFAELQPLCDRKKRTSAVASKQSTGTTLIRTAGSGNLQGLGATGRNDYRLVCERPQGPSFLSTREALHRSKSHSVILLRRQVRNSRRSMMNDRSRKDALLRMVPRASVHALIVRSFCDRTIAKFSSRQQCW